MTGQGTVLFMCGEQRFFMCGGLCFLYWLTVPSMLVDSAFYVGGLCFLCWWTVPSLSADCAFYVGGLCFVC